MRIAYVSLHWPRTKESGVGKKMLQQMKAWRDQGHEVQFFMHRLAVAGEEALIPSISSTYRAHSGLIGKLRTEIERSQAMTALLTEIRRFRPDVIYLRWSMFVFPAQALFTIAPVVMEINTNDVSQHTMLGFAYGLYNRLTRGIFLRGVKGLVCTSRELAEAPEFAAYKRAVCIIANGADLTLFEPLPAPNNEIPRLGFIGTPGMAWHGVDKLVNLARRFPDLEIDLIGYDRLDDGTEPPVNLHLHGYLAAADYRRVFAGLDAAIGTLALHRKAMREASPLKTRECLAFGIPMVIPYIDSDLYDFDSLCLLKIPNSEDNVQRYGKEIRDFAYAMRGKRLDPAVLSSRIGAQAKEARRLEFFLQCQGNKD